MRYCGKCGVRVSDAAVFCTECGSRLNDMEPMQYNHSYRSVRQQTSYNKSINSAVIAVSVAIAIIAVVVAAVVVCVVGSRSNGKTDHSVRNQVQQNNVVSADVQNSDIYSNSGEVSKGTSDNNMPDYIEKVKQDLGIPDDMDVTYKVSDVYYWQAGLRYLICVDFYYDGEDIAGAEVDAYTYELIRGIHTYSGK